DVRVRAIRDVTDPVRDHLAARMASIGEDGDLAIIFVVEEDRSLSIRLRGEPLLVNQARDVLGEEEEIGPLLS
ncbi:MAG TPA: hypothetical protein VHG52_06945, partial [Thermomicrobiales bacterium]|nr:hypothetical protein [Thermomicrobiales bacterium]